jgi:hypothetical protein
MFPQVDFEIPCCCRHSSTNVAFYRVTRRCHATSSLELWGMHRLK